MKTMMQLSRRWAAAIISALAFSASAQSFTNDLVVYLDFDGTLAGQRGTTNHGAVYAGSVNGATYVSGPLGQAVSFNNDGNSSSTITDWAVSLGDLEWMYSNSFSVSVWVRMFEDRDAAVLGNKRWNNEGNIGWAVTTKNGKNVQWATPPTRQKVDLHPPILNGEWHLLTLTVDRANNRGTVYLDGVLRQMKKLSTDPNDRLTPLPSFPTLVGASGPANYAGRADVDDLGMWPRALSPAEVGQIYSYGLSGTNLGLNLPAAPVITQDPADAEVEAGTDVAFTGAAEGVEVTYQWQYNGVDLPRETLPTLTLIGVRLDQAGDYGFTASNSGGVTVSAVAALTVVDTIPPVLTCALDKTVACGSEWSFDSPTVSDNGGEEWVVVTGQEPVTNVWSCGTTFTAERTWTAVDSRGNAALPCTQVVIVMDTTPPTLVCASDKTVECGEPWAFDPPFARDECVFNTLVYDNSRVDLLYRFNSAGAEVGDEIVLEGTARYLQEFAFEYWGVGATPAGFAGPVEARLRFYANDGPLLDGIPTPGTVIYDSGSFAVAATDRAVLIFDDFVSDAVEPLQGPLPDTFTWTVQFSGLGAEERAGVDLYSPPAVGLTYPDYWEAAPAGWILKANAEVPVDFAARVVAADEAVTVAELSTDIIPGCGQTFTATRTWQATDPCGLGATCSQTVTVVDSRPPTLRCADDKTVECGDPLVFDPPAAGDECVFQSFVYDNSENDQLLRFNSGAIEVGDEIVLEGTARYARQFVVEYWGEGPAGAPAFAGDVQACVRFYRNDGAESGGAPGPGSVLYDSGWFAVAATRRATLIIEDFIVDAAVPLREALPTSFTWSIQFTGLDAGDKAGVDLFSPPVIGDNYPDYWERTEAGWVLMANDAGAVDFAALLVASEENVTIVEVGTVAVPLPGGLTAVTRTWRATDACGNAVECSQTVSEVDPTPPVPVCPADLVLNCDVAAPLPDPDAVEVADGCDAAPWVEHVDDVQIGSNPRVVRRTYRAFDASGNTADCQQLITFQNVASLPPVITTQPQSRTVNSGATATFFVAAVSCESPGYQWFFNAGPLVGETGPSLTLPNVTLARQGTYFVRISNAAGEVESSHAVLVVNLPPVALPDSLSAETGTTLVVPGATLMANDYDPDGDPLTIVSVSPVTQQGGSATVLGADIQYTPPAAFVGSDQFFYTIRDGRGGFSTSTILVQVDTSAPPAAGQLTIYRTVNGGYLLRLTAAAAGIHVIQRAPYLHPPTSWEEIEAAPLAAGAMFQFIDANPPAGMAFYRFEVQ